MAEETKKELSPLPMQPGEKEAMIRKYTDAGYTQAEAEQKVKDLSATREPAKATEEDRMITEEEIGKAFEDYGFTPSRADLGYWVLKPYKEYAKLYENLGKRKEDETKRTAEKYKNVTGEGEAFFRGKYALVKFQDDPDGAGPATANTVWLIDPNTKQMRPFLNEQAFKAYFGQDIGTVAKSGQIVELPSSSLAQGGYLTGFQLLGDEYGVNPEGKFKEAPKQGEEVPTTGLDMAEVEKRYGQEKNQQWETDVLKYHLDGLLKFLKTAPESGVSAAYIDEIAKDPNLMKHYAFALAYGGYYEDDIIRDIKRRQLVANGREDLANVKVIDPTQTADVYYSSEEGKKVADNADLLLPSYLNGVNTSLFNNSVYNLPDEAFQVLNPALDWNTPEGQKALDEISTSYYDNLQMQLSADTEQAKAVAQTAWKDQVESIKRKYGLQLSENVETAQNQIEQIQMTMGQRGLRGSGIEHEAIDDYLRRLRKTQSSIRADQLSDEEQKKLTYYSQYASPEEIAQLSPEEKVKYGITPSADIMKFYDVANLKAKYPQLSDKEIQAMRSSVFDEFGNYRSDLYSKKERTNLQTAEAARTYQVGEVTRNPETGEVTGGYGATYKEAIKPPSIATEAPSTRGIKQETPPAQAPVAPPAPANAPAPVSTPAEATPEQVRVPGLTELKKYKEEEIQRTPGSTNIFLKPGVQKRW
jgi:hypothetical protein